MRVQPCASRSCLVQATMRDQPFLVDTAREVLRCEGISIHRFLHPILRTERGDGSRLLQVRPRPQQGTAESFLHFEVEPLNDAAIRRRLEKEIRESLSEAARAAGDYPQMRAAAESVARTLAAERPSSRAFQQELAEAADFLLWLVKGNFIFLGYRSHDIEEKKGKKVLVAQPLSALGILSNPELVSSLKPEPVSRLDPSARALLFRKIFPLITKTNWMSRVHRRTRMDSISIKKISPAGEITGEHCFLGFFTSQALNQLASEIPVLRRKLARILEGAQVLEGTHDYKEIVKIFNELPKEELFTTGDDELAGTIRTVMEMQSEEGIRVACRRDNLGNEVSVLVILPRDRFNTEARLRIQVAFAKQFGIPPSYYRLALSEEQSARLHFYFGFPKESPLPPPEALEREVKQAIRTWDDRLLDELEMHFGPERGRDLGHRFFGAIPSTYRDIFAPAEAVEDLPIFKELGEEGGVQVRMDEGPHRGDEKTTLIRLYRARSKFYLSDVMPILANLGLQVIDEMTFRIEGRHLLPVYLHTIRIQDGRIREGLSGGVEKERWGDLAEAILAILDRKYENDGLGALILAGLSIRKIELLRTYLHFYRQLRVPYTWMSMVAAVTEHPEVANRLVGHFETKFRPDADQPPADAGAQRAEALDRSRQGILELLEKVEGIIPDRILRGLLDLMDATLRTNYFQGDGKLHRIAIKVQSGNVPGMPRPIPLFEIFVHNAEMEGIHLRAGKVARGGIRWSDRRDDFRTEILGLMRTQFEKNSVIVPVGSKGGFVLKQAGDSRGDLPAQVAQQYQTLISGLLDLTDNLEEGQVIHPPGTVIYDGPDPYLVVAADRGTATFSDLANSIAAEYGYWLGDAFASGGSRGYDHKKEGITGRGAWECVRSHLRELEIDPDGDITVAGIGDMSGDVFGNGLLLSKRFKLVAAFDHRHIFIDPQPDPVISHEERSRLFHLRESSWADYDPKKISRGGGVFRRDAKRIPVSAEIRELFGIQQKTLTGEELMREVLRLPVDLLWNGGIGTYVKASDESNAEVGDSRNDSVRINARELQARVVAEGGNLGFTQAARIEFALRGGKVNTDFIDNSAGVDLSDHEVNIKIALVEALRKGRLDLAGRDRLLKKMTREVCGQVLENNRQHALALSLEELLSRQDLCDHLALARQLAEEGLLEAKFEHFPDAEEIQRRSGLGTGLLRPELAHLLAFTKLEISRALRERLLVETAGFEDYLARYFPQPLRKEFGDLLHLHPLRREIAVLSLTNEVVARMGVTFISRLQSDLGVTVEDACRAYRAADSLLDGPSFASTVSDLLTRVRIPPRCAYQLLLDYRGACDQVVRWLLRFWPEEREDHPKTAAGAVEELKPSFRKLAQWISKSAPDPVKENIQLQEKELAELGAPPELASRAARLELERQIPQVIFTARRTGTKPLKAAAVHFSLWGALEFPEVERAVARVPATDPDDRSAARALLLEIRVHLAELTAAVLQSPGGLESEPAQAIRNFLEARESALNLFRRTLPGKGRPFGLGSLMVLAERLRRFS